MARTVSCLLLLLMHISRCNGFVSLPAATRYLTSRHHNDDSSLLRYAQRDDKSSTLTQWVTCSYTRELTEAVTTLVQKTDVVAELGSQLRDVSDAICHSCHSCILVDVKRKFPSEISSRSRAMRRPGDETKLPGYAAFHEISTLEQWRQALFFNDVSDRKPFDVLVLDVSVVLGNDLEWTTLSLIREFLALQESIYSTSACRLVLVKSASLNSLASRLRYAQSWLRQPEDYDIPFPHTIAAVGVQQYRQSISKAVHAGDAVLEVGCHLGTTTALLHDSLADYCIGVDVGANIIKGAKERHPHLHFALSDAWKTADLLRIQQHFLEQNNGIQNHRIGFDVVYVDVGGLSGADGLFEALMLLSALQNALEPRYVVIKSLCVQRLASALVPYWRIQKKLENMS